MHVFGKQVDELAVGRVIESVCMSMFMLIGLGMFGLVVYVGYIAF